MSRSRLSLLLLLLLSAATAAAQPYRDPFGSNPADAQTNVLRERGRKGLLFHFRYQDGGNPDRNDAVVWPLDMSGATVQVTIGVAAPLPCTNTSTPAANACGWVLADGPDADGFQDTVRIFYNGDFPASTAVTYTVSGAKAHNGVAQDVPSGTSVAFTTGTAAPRTPANVELVFDISGSMDWPVAPMSTTKRIDALKNAAQAYFLAAPNYAALGDKVGVVYFSTAATVFDPTPGGSNMELVLDDVKRNAIRSDLLGRSPTFSTSIGKGLTAAMSSGFNLETGTKNVFLFSDGEQNDPLDVVAASGSSVTVGGAAYAVDLLCPVTAGVLSAPGFTLQQNIANARCSGNNAHIQNGQTTFIQADLDTYFMQTLQAMGFGDKIESVLDAIGVATNSVPVEHKFTVASDDQAASVLLSWDPPAERVLEGFDIIPFELVRPDGTTVDLTHRLQTARNMSFANVVLPMQGSDGKPINPAGTWTVRLLTSQMKSKQHNYHVMAMVDTPSVLSRYEVNNNDAGTGETLPLRVTLTDRGNPLTGANVIAEILAPNDGVGNILSNNKPREVQPNPDPDSPAMQNLHALELDPTTAGLFRSNGLPAIRLFDDGTHGDATANDGVYSADFTQTNAEGHYRFQFRASGTAGSGKFERTQISTRFVRPKPSTTTSTLVTVASTASTTTLRFTPRDAAGNLLGPDYLTRDTLHFDAGSCPITSLADRLDGTYDIVLGCPPSANPTITITVFGQPVFNQPLTSFGHKRSRCWFVRLWHRIFG
jgi:hypothetical protein